MSEFLPLFDDARSGESKTISGVDEIITESQRRLLRDSFNKLGVIDAPGQFALVEELTGQRISFVNALTRRNAQTLIYRLEDKVRSIGRKNSGNAWDDREENTWIDNL